MLSTNVRACELLWYIGLFTPEEFETETGWPAEVRQKYGNNRKQSPLLLYSCGFARLGLGLERTA